VCCSVVQCGAVWCSVVQCGAVWCGAVWCDAVWYSVVQCGAVCCDMLQYVAESLPSHATTVLASRSVLLVHYEFVFQYIIVCCSVLRVLQYVAVYCSVLHNLYL